MQARREARVHGGLVGVGMLRIKAPHNTRKVLAKHFRGPTVEIRDAWQ